MSYWKTKSAEQDEALQSYLELLLEVSALQECENHGGIYFEGSNDVESAYKLANKRVSSGEIVLGPGQSRGDMTDLIKTAYDDNSVLSRCPICEKHFGPD